MKILIAEDDQDSRVLLEVLLSGDGHTVQSARDGQEAVDQALRDPPDLIVSDILMPRLDGFGLCRFVRGSSKLKAIPIVLYTATYTGRRDEELALRLGADRFIVKPVEPSALLQILTEVMAEHARQRPRPRRKVPAEATRALHLERLSTKLDKKMTELAGARDALWTSEARFQDFSEAAGDFFWETDAALKITYATGPCAAQSGRSLPDLLRSAGADTDQSPQRARADLETILTTRKRFHDWNTRWKEGRVLQFGGKPYYDQAGRFAGYRGIGRDRTETVALESRLSHLAEYDPLTGLVNRSAFVERLATALCEARELGTPHALCCLDVDQFKIINDTAGQAAGDELLRRLASMLKARIRSADVAARVGGDEFAVLLKDCPVERAVAIAEELSGAVCELGFAWGGRQYETCAGVGICTVSPNAENAEVLLTRADVACYAAKALGRNRVQLYERSAGAEAAHLELLRAAEINELLRNERFCLYAQPILPLAALSPRPHAEVLLRCLGPGGQILAPGAIIAAAERFGMMPSIDRWTLAKTLASLSAAPGIQSDTVIGVNLSGQSLSEQGFGDYIDRQLGGSGVDPERICFEITETAAIRHLTEASRFILALRSRGCLFALDDFGSGMSSFSYLKGLAVDFLKIDGSFVRDIASDPIDRAMVMAMRQVGAVMGIRTVAEWVETNAAAQALTEIGVDYGQGYGLARPMPFEDLGGLER
ncbi:MAG: two-component system response regulator [Gammaproteobacteria bacterium]